MICWKLISKMGQKYRTSLGKLGVLELLVAIVNRIVRGDLIEKMRFKQRNEGCEGVNCTDIWRKIFRQR